MSDAQQPVDDSLVVLMTTSNPNEARVIQAVLSAAGIEAVVEGENLSDEWAASQRLLGGVGCAVKVPASQHEEAKTALAKAKEEGHQFEDESFDAEFTGSDDAP